MLDSNVLVAMLVEEHEHHKASYPLFADGKPGRFASTAHNFAEAYVTMTRRSVGGYGLEPAVTIQALEGVWAGVSILALAPQQSFDAIRSFALSGGIGPRLYDRLIGEAAMAHGIPTLITWNTRHLVGLFPSLAVVTPAEYLRRA